jgi:hypothetical protein
MKNCVVLRCGSADVAAQWQKKTEGTGVDLYISFFSDTAFREFQCNHRNAFPLHFKEGGKWTGIFDALRTISNDYDYYFFPDDDLVITADSLVGIFALMDSVKASVGQPSLDHQSYFSHLITIRHPNILWRKTNFVEVMAPCLSAKLLEEFLPYFAKTESGFGLDYAWCMCSGQ